MSTHAGVATVLIDHAPINLMTVPVYRELADTIGRLATDDGVRVVVFRSANPEWFIAHFDVAAILEFPTEQGPAPTELNTYHLMCEQLRQMPKATIAVIEGRVGGGGSELALSCDMRFAGPTATFNQPEVALGILPGGTGTVRLPRLIGRSRALFGDEQPGAGVAAGGSSLASELRQWEEQLEAIRCDVAELLAGRDRMRIAHDKLRERIDRHTLEPRSEPEAKVQSVPQKVQSLPQPARPRPSGESQDFTAIDRELERLNASMLRAFSSSE